jgi:hypothetical protein
MSDKKDSYSARRVPFNTIQWPGHCNPCLKRWNSQRMLSDEEGKLNRKFRFSATFQRSAKQIGVMDRQTLPKV